MNEWSLEKRLRNALGTNVSISYIIFSNITHASLVLHFLFDPTATYMNVHEDPGHVLYV
jgi:hypothetical protein